MIKTSNARIEDAIERLLIVSDIHSYYRPLVAFDERRKSLSGAHHLIFNGDMFHGGPQPRECTEWLISNAHLATIGNHDAAMLRGDDGKEHPSFTEPGGFQRLSEEQREYFRQLPHRLEVSWRGHQIVLMHGHVNRDGKPGSWMSSPATQIENFLEDAALCVTSHTHYPFKRDVGGTIFANTGSMAVPILGVENNDGFHVQSGEEEMSPEDSVHSSFLSVTESNGRLDVEIMRFDYDRSATIDDLRRAGQPKIARYERWLTEGIVNF